MFFHVRSISFTCFAVPTSILLRKTSVTGLRPIQASTNRLVCEQAPRSFAVPTSILLRKTSVTGLRPIHPSTSHSICEQARMDGLFPYVHGFMHAESSTLLPIWYERIGGHWDFLQFFHEGDEYERLRYAHLPDNHIPIRHPADSHDYILCLV